MLRWHAFYWNIGWRYTEPMAKTSSVGTTLMYAAYAGDLEMARLMLENGAPVNVQTDVGTTALMYAAAYGHMEVVRFLVENGADIHILNGYGYTALSLAEERGHQEVVDFLRSVEDAG